MNDRAKPARSLEQNGKTPLSEWGSEVGDYQDSADIDDAFAELLEKSPVRSSEEEQSAGGNEARLSPDDLPGSDVSESEVAVAAASAVEPVAPAGPTETDGDLPPEAGAFSLLGYLLESGEESDSPVQGDGADDPPLESDAVDEINPDALDDAEAPDDAESGDVDRQDEAELDDSQEDSDLGVQLEEPVDAGLVIVERSRIVDSGPEEVDREPEPGLEFAPPSQRHPGDLAGSTLYSSDGYDSDDFGGMDDTKENTGLASSFWEDTANAPAWHPDAPTNLQHSAVVPESWESPSLPSRTVRSPGERRRPQTALDVVGELTDRPGFWKSMAALAVVGIGGAFYSIGFFDEVLGGGGETTTAQVVRSGATLPETEIDNEPPDALGDLQSALTDDAGDLAISTGSGGEDEPAAPTRRVDRSSSDAVATTASTEPATSTSTSTTEPSASTSQRQTSTTVRSSTTSTRRSSTTTTSQPATTRQPTTTRPVTTTTTTEATTTTRRTPPSRGRPTTTTTTTTTTTAPTTSSTTTASTTTSTSQPTTSTSEPTTTTTEATTSSTEAGGGE